MCGGYTYPHISLQSRDMASIAMAATSDIGDMKMGRRVFCLVANRSTVGDPHSPDATSPLEGLSARTIDILNKDCRRSISAILTWVLENVKISARPLNSTGNQRFFTLLLKFYLLPLAHTLLRVKCRYMSLVCINVQFFQSCSCFSSRFFSRVADLSSGMNDVHATRLVCRSAKKTSGNKTT